MKLVSYNKDEQDQLALLADDLLYDIDLLHPDLPVSMSMFLNYWEDIYAVTTAINQKLEDGKISRQQGFEYDAAEILAPVPHATSCRIANAFKQHIPGNEGMPEPTIFPQFYFANHNCFQGSGDIICMPDNLKKLDFELQLAIVICRAGKNITAAKADDYIGGYMIMNNISAENNVGFATPIGPMLVTPDELEPFKVECKPGHTGNTYNLSMKCFVNEEQVSDANAADMHWTFAEIIEQASYGVQLFPGDIISSGPANTGSFKVLNVAGKLTDTDYKERWLQDGDVVEMEIEGLGRLTNTIVKDESDFSLLAQKNITSEEE